MTKKEKRLAQLLDILKGQGLLPVKALATLLQVSEMTIRRDLETLEYMQLSAIQGYPSHAEVQPGGYSLLQAIRTANEQKCQIGEFAATLIEQGDMIIIDTGSTTAKLLPHIPDDKNLSVLCYNANVMLELRHKPGINLLMSGGHYHPSTALFASPEGVQFIQRNRANKVFLSAAGVHPSLGITCANAYEVPIKQAAIQSSLERILVVDSSKFGQLRSAWFCELSEVSTIVTDRDLSEEWRERIVEMGIVLHTV